MKRQGPDSVNSWLITAGLFVVSTILYGVVRLSGVLFVASMYHYGVDRKKASLPFILTDFIQAISSPLTGYLASKFGVRLVMSLGCFISGIGIAACFFAQTIESVTIFWGVIFGVGYGLSVPLLAVGITQHFVKKRATALGIVFLGTYVGYSIFPGIVEYMIDKYGLSGSFFLIAGIMFNCIPVALLLRNPTSNRPKSDRGKKRSNLVGHRNSIDGGISIIHTGFSNTVKLKGMSNYGYKPENYFKNECINNEVHLQLTDGMDVNHVTNFQTDKKQLEVIDNIGFSQFCKDKNSSEVMCHNLERDGMIKGDSSKEGKCVNFKSGSNLTNANSLLNNIGISNVSASSSVHFINPTNSSENEERPNYPNIQETSDRVNPSVLEKSTPCEIENNKKSSPSKISKLRAFQVFLEPVFLVVLICEAVYEGSFIAFVTVLVDFSLDVGLPFSDTKFVILAFSIASNVGLVSFGWVTDDGHLSLTTFSGVLLLIRGATSAFIPFSTSLPVLLTAVALHGLCEAPLANLFTLLIPEFYAPEVQEVAISCRLFLCAPVYLLTPTLIGYFRDDLGSYLYLFLLMSGSSLACGVLCFLIPQLSKCRCGRDETILRKRSLF